MVSYTEQDCIDALQDAAKEYGDDLTNTEYMESGLSPHRNTIVSKFGSWDAAKRAAGLDVYRDVAVNTRYFSTIDTAEKAYWLGFLGADGYVTGPKVGLKLRLPDRPHVEAFADAVDSEYAISDRPEADNPCVVTEITNPDFRESVVEAGITPGKSRDNSLPEPPEGLEAPFLRGFFEADGGIHPTDGEGRKWRWSIVSNSRPRLEKLLGLLESLGIDDATVRKRGDRDQHILRLDRRNAIVDLFGVLYPEGSGTEPALSRKADRFSEARDSLVSIM